MKIIKNKQINNGFTVIELVIAIGVVAVLVSIVTWVNGEVITTAKNTAINTSVADFIGSLETQDDAGYYPLENYIQSSLDAPLKAGFTGIGSDYRRVITYVVNTDSLKKIIEKKGLESKNVAELSFAWPNPDASGGATVVQDSENGYFNTSVWNSTDRDLRAAKYMKDVKGLDNQIEAYAKYQKEILGLVDIPSVYTADNVFSSVASTGSGRNIPMDKTYPFISIEATCKISTKKCHVGIGYYLYGKTSSCPNYGIKTIKVEDEVLYNTAYGKARDHNMTFCTTYLGDL